MCSGHPKHPSTVMAEDGSQVTLPKLLEQKGFAQGLRNGKTFIDLDEEVPRYSTTPELNIRLPTNILSEKQETVEAAVEIFRQKGYPIDSTDGGLIQWIDINGKWHGQALARKSNTQPMVICCVEGRDEKARASQV